MPFACAAARSGAAEPSTACRELAQAFGTGKTMSPQALEDLHRCIEAQMEWSCSRPPLALPIRLTSEKGLKLKIRHVKGDLQAFWDGVDDMNRIYHESCPTGCADIEFILDLKPHLNVGRHELVLKGTGEIIFELLIGDQVVVHESCLRGKSELVYRVDMVP